MAKVVKIISIESKITNLRIVENAIDELTGAIGVKQDDYGKIMVAAMEAVNNAITHGNKSDPEKKVDIEISYENNEIRVKVTDEGSGFDPESIPDPTKPENIEELSGRGVFLMSRLADTIEFNENGNSVTMCFREVVI
ncbi:MAG: ATP-binding protein [Bacteroidales bacterium]|jgi:serine/threonine-protein kinase RsbW|nr:ATP-binding protein [Bacteroidales bacterium]